MSQPFSSILITGASSGIGATLARLYAGPGVRLALQGRDSVRLEAVAADCRKAGATVDLGVIDVTARAGLADWILALDRSRPFDLVIANAGVGTSASRQSGYEAQIRHVFAVNLDGSLNTILPLIEPMRARRRGTIAFMSSLASFRGLPGSPAYGASKAAVRLLAEGLRPQLAQYGVTVSVICPGFVTTPMTAQNRFRMPFLMSVERAGDIIVRGLAAGRERVAFPWQTYWLAVLFAALPPALSGRLIPVPPPKPAAPI